MRIISRAILLAICVTVLFEILLLWLLMRGELNWCPGDQRSVSSRQLDSSFRESHMRKKTVIPEIKKLELRYAKVYPPHLIHIAVVVCGERTEEATTMLKSITLLTRRQLYFHILAEDERHNEIKSTIDAWPCSTNGQVDYMVHPPRFPSGKSSSEWKNLFKPCSAQRLFLPSVLKHVDSLIYLDIDCLVLRPIEDVWQHFSDFNSTQLAAVAPEGEVPGLNWYKRFARNPYYGQLGINSGVMLMNLTRMRSSNWEEKMLAIYKKYKLEITWGDQDILNIYFHFHPELVYVIGCEWNFRPDHCIYGSNCKTAETNGISVLHANRENFHRTKRPFFRVIYEAFKWYHHGDDFITALMNLRNKRRELNQTHCGALANAILKHPLRIARFKNV